MSIISSAIAHFSNKEIRHIDVEEWGGVFYAKNLTLEDKSRMLSRSDGNSMEYLVYALIFGLVDSNGDPVFTLEDKVSLKTKVDPDVVSRVASFILRSGSEEEREKN